MDFVQEIEEEGLGLRHVFFKCTVLASEGEVEFCRRQGIENRKKAVCLSKPEEEKE